MSAYFATEYTIHFDDTMAYGGHHFLTSFKFQCAARETFLFGESVFDIPGVKDALDQVHLLTSDAYARNLHSTKLGDRVAILLSLEEWGRVSARFCYRVINEQGQRISAGFQTLICADAETGNPMPLPTPLRQAMDAMREIEEIQSADSFRDCVLAGGSKLDSLFGDSERDAAVRFLSQRYPSPGVIPAVTDLAGSDSSDSVDDSQASCEIEDSDSEAWVFAGQGAFDAKLLSERVDAYVRIGPSGRDELDRCAAVAAELIGGDPHALVGGSVQQCREAIEATPALLQVAIHLQNVLGAMLWTARGHQPSLLMGHSFGEIAAFGIGGCFDLPTGVRVVCLRAQAITTYAPIDGGLLAVSSDRHHVETEANLLALDQVVVAGRNHDKQTVMSGPLDQLNRLHDFLQSTGISSVNVPSPTSFHHPGLRLAASRWREQLRSLRIDKPSCSIYSPIGRRYISPNDDVASVLASQLLMPFDLQGSISDAVAAGVTKFVDCGSTGSLASLISKSSSNGLAVCSVQSKAAGELAPLHSAKHATHIENSVASERDVASRNGSSRNGSSRNGSSRNGSSRNGSSRNGHRLPQKGETIAFDRSVVPAIAIVGQGCLLPGGACSPEQLFASITEQRMGIIDQRRFDPHWSEDFYSESLVADRSTSHLSGRVNAKDIAVPTGIDPIVFYGFTRTQQLLCIALAPCVGSLKGAERVVCLIGATADGFEDQDEVSSLVYAGIDPSDHAVNQRMNTARSENRTPHDAVQEVFDRIVRPGVKVTLIDAACASSLYAVALGMQTLETGKADAVIAGGCFCPGPGNSCLFSQFHGTTSTGCRPFDANADGVVFSEGAALVTLRRVADAKQFGVAIQATVRGVGLSSDGKSSSANVPQTNGQILSLERCYANYGIDPASIHAIEGHGTSTSVGDATELETLQRFFAKTTRMPIPVHSLKATLGHAGWAAGTASLIAACEYLRRGVFPAQACHREPSNALKKSAGTLTVPNRPVSLPPQERRIAIDGFGFGGANAHLVIESVARQETARISNSVARAVPRDGDDELVFVACHHERPTLSTSNGLQFDRDNVKLPEGHIVLPELADDMDVSQTLAVILTEQVIAQIPHFDDELRKETSLVLAMRGKTERGIEATTRIMGQRFRRNLDGHDQLLSALDAAHDRARPSGPYTLQCMMPNVAAGRAALLLNLHGPNFVVDSGPDSLSAAISSAGLLLRSGDEGGTKLAVVAAIDANSLSVPDAKRVKGAHEFAAAFGVTTRGLARTRGWKVISDVEGALEKARQVMGNGTVGGSTFDQVRSLVESLGGENDEDVDVSRASTSPIDSSSDTECPIHIPIWVEKRASVKATGPVDPPATSLLVIAPANAGLVAELVTILPKFATRFLVSVVGNAAKEIASQFADPCVIAVDLADGQNLADGQGTPVLRQIDEFEADVVTVVQAIDCWDLSESLSTVASDNSLCEFLFLVAQRDIERLKLGRVELWGLFVDGWKGVVHPLSGAVAGLLKSVHREIPASRVGSICTRGLALSDTLQKLFAERLQTDPEHEIVYDENVRLVRRLRRASDGLPPSPQVKLDSNSVVIATGGAKGVTAVMLEAILRDHQCTVIAFGRSPLEAGPENCNDVAVEQEFYRQFMKDNPNASALEMKVRFESTRARWDAHQTIQKLDSLGGNVEYMVVDVTERDHIARAVQQIASRYGRVDFLIHGAGVQVSKRLEHRSIAEFQKTYSVKVSGLANLVKCCQAEFGRTITTHVLTSAYSVFGNDGQHDYCAANETMDRICGLAGVGGKDRWASIAWLAWDGIGMTRGSEYRVLAEQRSLSGVSPRVGQRLFRDVLAGQTGSAINVPISDAELIEYEIKTVPPAKNDSIKTGRVIEISVALSEIECLPFHKIRNTPTLPGAWILDRLVNAALQLCPDTDRIKEVTVQDVLFTRFVRFAKGQEPNVRVVAEETDHSIVAWMIADVLHPTGRVLSKDVICAKAILSFGRQPGQLRSSVDGLHGANGHGADRFVSDPYCQGTHREIDLSGPFDCLGDIKIGAGGRRAKFAPDGNCTWSGDLPALLLDAAWRVGAMYATSGNDQLFVPVQIGRMVIPVGEDVNCTSASGWEIRSTHPKPEGRDVYWDRTEVIDHDGMLRLVVENSFAKRIA